MQPRIKPRTRKKSEKAKVVAARINQNHGGTKRPYDNSDLVDAGITTHKAIRLAGRVLGKSYRVRVLATPETVDVGIP